MLLPMLALLAWPNVSPAVVDAPTVPPWPDDTPAPVLVPKDGRCLDPKGAELGAGLYMPDRLAGIVNGRLEALSSFPARCQVRINGAIDIERAECSARMQHEIVSQPHGLSPWIVGGLLVGALAVGALGGAAAVSILRP